MDVWMWNACLIFWSCRKSYPFINMMESSLFFTRFWIKNSQLTPFPPNYDHHHHHHDQHSRGLYVTHKRRKQKREGWTQSERERDKQEKRPKRREKRCSVEKWEWDVPWELSSWYLLREAREKWWWKKRERGEREHILWIVKTCGNHTRTSLFSLSHNPLPVLFPLPPFLVFEWWQDCCIFNQNATSGSI